MIGMAWESIREIQASFARLDDDVYIVCIR